MRAAVIGGVLTALLPTLAVAQTRVELGDGVSVVFPSAPTKIHMTTEPPPPGASAAGGMAGLQAFRSTDMWMLRMGGAMFSATVMTPRQQPGAPRRNCAGPPLPVPPRSVSPRDSPAADLAAPRENRRVFDGTLSLFRSIQLHGRDYTVMFTLPGTERLAKLHSKEETPSEAVGEAFVNSFETPTATAK
jgi:hypothetical protein